jgi:hypothetical protein
MAEYLYTIKYRQTDEILFQGSQGKCTEFLGCDRKYLAKLAKRDRQYNADTKYAKYKVERHVQGEHSLGGSRIKDVVCCDCGVFMENVSAKRKRCPECAYKHDLEQNRNRMRMVRNLKNLPPPIPSNPGREYCEGCVYYRGDFEINKCCNYYLDTGKRRPCPPGRDCTSKRSKNND